MSLRIRIERALALVTLLAAVFLASPPDASATHYPPGARCYDCHTTSMSNMVSGTSLIKESAFTADLISKGWSTAGSVPCVYCHRKDATSVPNVTKMKPVDLHFGSGVVSKHDANYVTNFTTVGASLDCRDCHTSITGVTYNSVTGDANVHGLDAETQNLSVYDTLIKRGVPAPTATTLQETCLASTCHGNSVDQGYGAQTAKVAHGYAASIVSRGALKTAFSDCSQCHSSHRSETQTGLTVILDTGGVDAQDGVTTYTPDQYLTADECEGCHVQDDDGTTYSTKGHGQASMGGGLLCTACHTDTVPHSFATGAVPTNPQKFRFPLGGAQTSAIRQQAPHNSAPSICLTCHNTFTTASLHGGTNIAGCNDCHEPHGTGVGTNVRMIRSQIPKTNGSGTPIYGQASPTGTWETNTFQTAGYADYFRADGAGICDNAECHQGRVINSNTIYPLAALMAGPHSGGVQAPGSDCQQCHTHLGGMAAANCSSCHGDGVSNYWPDGVPGIRPDRAGAHAVHVADISAARSIGGNSTCNTCHPGTHVGDQDNPPADISQDGTNNATYMKTMTGADDTLASYSVSTQRCANVACHSRETTPAWYGVSGTLDTTAPTVSTLQVNGSATPSIQAGTATVVFTATATDGATGNSNIAGAEYFVGIAGPAGTGLPLTAVDGAFDTPTENLTATVDSSIWVQGTTILYVRAKDYAGNWGTAQSINVTVTAKDAFTVANAAGPTDTSAYQGAMNLATQVLTFSATSGGTSVLIDKVQITGTGQNPGVNISSVKIWRDNGAVANVWDATDTLVGTGVLDAGNVALIDIADQTVTNPTSLAYLVTVDISRTATVGEAVGTQLTGVTPAATDALTTVLPLPAAALNNKTVTTLANTVLHPSGVSVTGAWTATGGTAATVMDTADLNTSYMSTTSTALMTADIDDYMMAATISGVTISASATRGNATACTISLTPKLGASLGTAYTTSVTGTQPTYGLYTSTNFATRPGGGAWTWADIPNLQVNVAESATCALRVSELYVTIAVAADSTAPTLSVAPAAVPASIQAGTATVTLNATCADTQSTIVAAEYFVTTEGAAGTGIPMTPVDGSFNSGTEAVTATVNSSAWAANTPLYVDCRDSAGNWGPASAGTTTVTVTAKDNFTVAGTAGTTDIVNQGSTDQLMEVLNFTATGSASVQINGMTITGTKSATGQGTVTTDVSRMRIYRDNGGTPDQLDGTDTLMGTMSFDGAGVAAMTFGAPYTLNVGTPQKFLVIYDISATAGVGDVIGASLTAVATPATDNLTTALPVASGNIKTIQSLVAVCGTCHSIPPAGGSHLAHANNNADYTECVHCHTNNGGLNYSVTPAGTHNNGSTNVDAATTAYSGGTTGTCLTASCHSYTGNLSTWGTAASLGCNECHYYDATPTTAENVAPMTPITGSHNAHFDASQGSCVTCHNPLPVDLGHIDVATGADDLAILINKANAVNDEATVTVTTWNDTSNTCANTSCHNPSGDTHVSPAWGTATSGCETCHNYSAAPPSGSHTQHVGTGFGLNVTCNHCHPTQVGDGHMNTVKSVSVFKNTIFTAVASPTIAGGCGTNDCHRANPTGNVAPINTTYTWGTPEASNCGICHYDMNGAGTDTNAHYQHVASNAMPNATNINECYVCHNTSATSGGLATGASHMSNANNVAFTAGYGYEATTAGTTGSGGAMTCNNIKCHNGSVTPSWATVGINCGKCHGTTNDLTVFDPRPTAAQHTAGSHASHANDDAVYTDCANCHQNAASYTVSGGDANHQNLAVNLYFNGGLGTYSDPTTGVGGVNYVNGTANPDIDDGTCGTTGCHGGATPVWGGTIANSCFACHDGVTETAGPSPTQDGAPNVVTMADYNDTGHGRSAGAYDLNALNDGLGNAAANMPVGADGSNCYLCHDSASNHVPKDGTNDPYRLGANATNVNAVCLQGGTCHTPDMGVTIEHHATYAGGDKYMDVKCVDCHDPHGDDNMFMVHNAVAVDGAADADGDSAINPFTMSNTYATPEATRAVVFTADTAGSNFASIVTGVSGNGVCEVCHDATSWYGSSVNPMKGPQTGHLTTANCLTCHSHKESFRGGACDGCHGFPPVAAGQGGGAVPPEENYLGGGGAHKVHVDFIANKLGLAPITASTDPNQLCGPCHGQGAGTTNHAGSGKGPGAWVVADRAWVNILDRAGATSWAASGTAYGGIALPTGNPNTPNSTAAMSLANSRCINVDCHGTGNEAGVNVSWYLNLSEPDTETGGSYSTRASGGSATNAPNRAKVCETCHDETPANIRLYNAVPTLTYSSQSAGVVAKGMLGVATNFYATRSGYARGGHGDANIQTENGSVDSDRNHVTPVDCTACHDASVGHTARAAVDLYRLGWSSQAGSEVQNLCLNTSCHGDSAGLDYVNDHHASYTGNTYIPRDVVAAASSGARRNVTTTTSWSAVTGLYYEQLTGGLTSWGAGTSSSNPGLNDGINLWANPDIYIDWWGTNGGANAFDSTPTGDIPYAPVIFGQVPGETPKAAVPLEYNIVGSGLSYRVLCTSCHNPHGTDLFALDPTNGNGKAIPDNNMLRLRDEDNTLCNACH